MANWRRPYYDMRISKLGEGLSRLSSWEILAASRIRKDKHHYASI
jgi:hypothetical protein